jgi:uncharacterized LabA/DUF88 family protein
VLYIDNSNIFRGCKKSGWRPSYRRIKEFFETEEGQLWDVHFFASEHELPREKQVRFYQTLKNDIGFQVHTFRLANRKVICPHCGKEELVPAEKGVDVGLVTQLLRDLKNSAFDTAIIMSSDRDYLDAILEVRSSGRKVKILAWRWTLTADHIQLCKEKSVQFMFLEDFREHFEKPQGEVL